MVPSWPDAFDELVRELRTSRGRPALVDCASPHAAGALARLADRIEAVSVGQVVARCEATPSVSKLLAGVPAQPTLLLDIDVLFAPALKVEVLALLRRVAQRTPLIVAWPGQIGVTRLSYSLPGRLDHFDEPARDLLILRPVATEFPDEIPYRLERLPS